MQNINSMISYNILPLPYHSLDIDGNIIAVNNKWLDSMGYDTEKEVLNKHFSEFLPQKYKEKFKKQFQIFKKDGFVECINFELICKNGSILKIVLNGSINLDTNGKFISTNCIFTDLTEKINLENQLQLEKERLQLAIEGTNSGLWDCNILTNEVYFSLEWKQMLGYNDDEIKNDLNEWDTRVHPDDKDKVYADIQANHDGKTKIYKNMHRLKHKNGSWVWILDQGKTYFDENNKPVKMVGLHTNITNSIILETEYKNLFNTIKEGIAIYKVEDNGDKFIFKDFNPASEKINNIKKEDVIGKDVVDVFSGVIDMGLLDIFKKVYKSGEAEILPPVEYQDDNIKGWRKNYVYKLSNGDIVSIYEDLTHEHNQIEILNDMLKKQEFQNYYLETVFNAQSNIVVTTYGTKIDRLNQALLEFSQFKSLEEFKSKYDCICDLFIEKNGFLTKEIDGQNWLDYIYDNQDKIHKVVMLKENKEHVFIINAKRLNYDDAHRSVVVLNDITKLNEQDTLLIEQSKMASMGEMMESIAHQWRQPLSIISTSSSGIKMQKEFGMLTDEKLFLSCDNITESAQHLSDTIDDFRNFFHNDKIKKDFNIKDIYYKTINLLSSKFKNREIKIIENIDDINMNGFGNELVQVFMNILNNARDELEIKDIKRMIFVDIHKDSNSAIIKRKDNAGGIPQDILPQIFNSHFTTKQDKDGTGIGLYMTKKIIENSFSGIIEASNVNYNYDGKDYVGAEFTIALSIN